MLTGAQRVREMEQAPEVGLRFNGAPRAPEEALLQPRRTGYLMCKIAMEWTIALSLFVATTPLVLMLAAAVKLSSRGPALYSQMRLGRNGHTYRIFKLRTMVHNAEASTGPVWAAKNDCRITPLGNFLRNTHLDELPQLINVLRGEMNLIGPRPERPEIALKIERTLPDYRHRLAVRPGITGLAQMLAPADDPTDPMMRTVRRKMALDLHYVREMSFLLDVRIAIATPCHFLASAISSVRSGVLRSHGAEAELETGTGLHEQEAVRSA